MDCIITEKANIYAGEMAGEYLNELGKHDLATLSREQWLELINVITKNYETEKRRLTPCPF